jgi:hypothetical protein
MKFASSVAQTRMDPFNYATVSSCCFVTMIILSIHCFLVCNDYLNNNVGVHDTESLPSGWAY